MGSMLDAFVLIFGNLEFLECVQTHASRFHEYIRSKWHGKEKGKNQLANVVDGKQESPVLTNEQLISSVEVGESFELKASSTSSTTYLLFFLLLV